MIQFPTEFTVGQLAKLMGVKYEYLYNQVKRGHVPSEKRAGRPIIYSHVLREEMPTLYRALVLRVESMGDDFSLLEDTDTNE